MDSVDQGHIVEVSRNELVAAIFRDPSKSLDSKYTNLLEFVKQKLNYPPEYQNKVREKVSTFFSKFKTKYFAVHRRKDLFYKNHADWIGGKETFPSHKPVAGPGRPSSSFDDVGPRSKRRKVEHLVQNATGNESSFAASMSYRKEGQNDKAKVISKVSAASSVELKSCLSSFDSDNGILTADQALCVLLDAQLSVHQYNVIRDADKSRFPSYKKVLAAKKLCYPNENAISASDKHVCIALQDILDHTCIRLAQSISEVLMSINNVTNLKLHIKWGIDGTSGFTEYKQKFQNTSSKDGSMIVTCMVPLRLVGDTEKEKGVVLWQNSRPSSTRFCRPLHLQYEHETADLTRQEMSRVELEISNLRPTIIECGNINYPVSHALYFTMTDGKVCNAVTNTSSAQRCYICKLTSTKFNSIAAARQASVDVESLRFGISSILHAWLRMFECLLHIGYKLKVAKWRVTKADDKAKVEETKKNIQQGFKEQLGLIVDRPKPGYGSSNDGNTARRFFENIDISSTITGINKSLIYRFHIILITLSSGLDIDTTKFNIYCLKTAVLFIKLYPWYYMPTTVHKILMHSATVISHALLPIGLLSEEAQEARNKDLKSYREFHSRKCSRESTIRDVFNRLLMTSDPYISSCRKLPVKQTKSLPIEVTKMLKPYNYQKATSTAIDSDSNESDLTD